LPFLFGSVEDLACCKFQVFGTFLLVFSYLNLLYCLNNSHFKFLFLVLQVGRVK
jgi:hypothetical protein